MVLIILVEIFQQRISQLIDNFDQIFSAHLIIIIWKRITFRFVIFVKISDQVHVDMFAIRSQIFMDSNIIFHVSLIVYKDEHQKRANQCNQSNKNILDNCRNLPIIIKIVDILFKELTDFVSIISILTLQSLVLVLDDERWRNYGTCLGSSYHVKHFMHGDSLFWSLLDVTIKTSYLVSFLL